MKKLLLTYALPAVLAALGFYAFYRRGLDEGRARGCRQGIVLESKRVHDGWCRLLREQGVSDDTLGTGCAEPSDDDAPALESLRACRSDL